MKRLGWMLVTGGLLLVALDDSLRAAEPGLSTPSGAAVLRAPAGSSEIVITTTDRLAGAIHSLRWQGQEFIDSHDHGRQLQSACSFDMARADPFWAERYNPTEAGSRADGAGTRSSSRLLRLVCEGRTLHTTTQMAFWLAPHEDSSGRPALNRQVLSEHRVSKRVHLGHQLPGKGLDGQTQLDQVIEYDVTFSVPQGETHHFAQFEALTGYMPPEFAKFWKFNAGTGDLEPLDDGPGEQGRPVVFSTASGAHAMGVFSPDQPSRGFETAGYGRFRFTAEKVVKWNCVFRRRQTPQIAAGDYHFRQFVAVGTLDDVRQSLVLLAKEFAP